MKRIKQILIPFAMLFMLLNVFTVQADEDFAEKHIVLQISQPERQTLVMNVANNLIKLLSRPSI